MKELSIITVLTALTIALLLGLAAVQPIMESKTYNKLTGANTTWWDAMWVELRVQDQPQHTKQND